MFTAITGLCHIIQLDYCIVSLELINVMRKPCLRRNLENRPVNTMMIIQKAGGI